MSHQGAVTALCSSERLCLSAEHLFTHTVKEGLRRALGWKVRAGQVQKGLLMPSTQEMKASLSDLSPSLQAHWTSHFSSSWGLGRVWDKELHRKLILKQTLGKGILSLRLIQSEPSLIFQERQNKIKYHSSENSPQSLLTTHLYIPSTTALGPSTNAQGASHRCKQHPRALPAMESLAGDFLPTYCRTNQKSRAEM